MIIAYLYIAIGLGAIIGTTIYQTTNKSAVPMSVMACIGAGIVWPILFHSIYQSHKENERIG